MGFFQQIREFAHRYDPIGANLVDNMIRTDSRVVAEVSRGSDRVSNAIGLGGLTNPIGSEIRRESRKNIADPSRAVGRAAATVALMYGFGAMAGGGTAAGAGAGEAAAAGGATAGSGAAAGGYAAGGYSAAPWAARPEFVAAETGAAYGTYGASAAPWAGESALWGGAAGGAAGSAATGGGAPSASQPAASQSSPYGQAARSLATGVGTNVATSLLMPKPKQPAIEPVTEMPDPEAQALARRRKAAMKSRQGRTASILTSGG